MKVIRIIARLNVGGPARHVVFLTEALQDEEFQSSLIAGSVPEGEEDMSFFASEYAVQPQYIREMSRELSLKDAVSILRILRYLQREKPDIIHTHTAKAGTLGRISGFVYRWLTPSTLVGRPRKLKLVHTFHGHVFHSYYGRTKTRLFIAIERLLARIATDRIIVISPQQLREIKDEFRIGRRDQFQIVPLGIDVEAFRRNIADRKDLRNELGLNDGDLLVTFVGRLTEIKNLPLFLDVIHLYKKLDTSLPRLRFAIVGDGHLRESLERRAVELGVSDLVKFYGNRRETQRFYSASDIIALTSLNEGTPLSLIEGMAAGTPVISTGVGGVVDLLGASLEEKSGFHVCERGIRIDQQEAGKYLDGLIYLAKNEKLRLDIANRGRAFVESDYSKDRLVRDIKDMYRQLGGEPGRKH